MSWAISDEEKELYVKAFNFKANETILNDKKMTELFIHSNPTPTTSGTCGRIILCDVV